MSDFSSDFSCLRGAASDINNVAADLSDIVSVAITASSAVEGLSSDFGGLRAAVASTSVGMRAAVDNVTPLAGAFRQLQEHTGAAQTANKSMIAGLAGFIGKVDLASIAVSLLIEYGDDLVRAFTAGGESVEKLRKKLDAIDEFQDFDIAVKIAGAEGLEKLKLELEQLMAQKAYLENMISFDEAIEHARAAMKDVGELDVIHDSNAGIAALNAAIDAKSKYELQQAKRIEAGELSLERDESTRLLTKYLGMSRDSAEELFKLNQKNFEIAKQNAEIAKQTNKETEEAAGSVEKAGIAWKGVAKASREIEKDLQSVEESYPKEYETHEWMYQAGQDLGDAIGNIDLSIGAFTMAADDAAKKLSQNNYGYSPWLSAGYFFNPYGGSGTGDKETDDRGTGSWSEVASGLSDLQNALQYGGIEVRGLSSFAKAARSYDAYLNPPDGQDPNPADLYGAIGAAGVGVGQMVGGRVGNIISSTASMATMGATLAPLILGAGTAGIGAAVMGVVGLVSSIFGGGDDEERRARRDEARQQAFNVIQDMALSGGPLSAELMRRSDWSWQNLAGLRHTQDIADEFGVWWPERLMADNGVEGIADRQEMITAIDNLLLSIKGFTETGFSQSLDKLNIKYEYLAEKSHNLALVEKARLTDLIQLVTGINAETVVGSVSNAMSAAAAQGGDVGEIFMEGFTREILDGVADTAISQFVTSSIMPILEKPLAQIAQSMTAGEGFDASALAEAVSLAKSAAASVAPAVQELYEAFETSDMWASAIGEIHPLVTEVMGVSAESLTNVILQSFASLENEGGNIGDVFVRNFMSSVEDGLMIFAASQLVENVLSGMMQPVLGSIAEAISTTQMVSASLIESSMAQVAEVAKQAAPYVESLYKAFGGSKRAAPVRYSLGSKSRSTSNNQIAKALRSLESFRAGMFADTSISPGNIGAVQTQQSAVRTLVAQALHGADNDSRMAAMQNLPGAVSSSLQSALAVTANPLEYSRQVGEMSNMLAGVTGGRDATLRNVVTEIRELRRENEQLREIMAQLLDSGNENTDKLVSLTREIVQNSY